MIEIGEVYQTRGLNVRVKIVGFSSDNKVVYEYEGQNKSIHIRSIDYISFIHNYFLVKPKSIKYVYIDENGFTESYNSKLKEPNRLNWIGGVKIEIEEGVFPE